MKRKEREAQRCAIRLIRWGGIFESKEANMYVCEIRYDGDPNRDLYGPFPTNDDAMAFGREYSLENEEVVGYSSRHLLSCETEG